MTRTHERRSAGRPNHGRRGPAEGPSRRRAISEAVRGVGYREATQALSPRAREASAGPTAGPSRSAGVAASAARGIGPAGGALAPSPDEPTRIAGPTASPAFNTIVEQRRAPDGASYHPSVQPPSPIVRHPPYEGDPECVVNVPLPFGANLGLLCGHSAWGDLPDGSYGMDNGVAAARLSHTDASGRRRAVTLASANADVSSSETSVHEQLDASWISYSSTASPFEAAQSRSGDSVSYSVGVGDGVGIDYSVRDVDGDHHNEICVGGDGALPVAGTYCAENPYYETDTPSSDPAVRLRPLTPETMVTEELRRRYGRHRR